MTFIIKGKHELKLIPKTGNGGKLAKILKREISIKINNNNKEKKKVLRSTLTGVTNF